MSDVRKLIVKESGISGKGVFAGEDFAVGDVVMIWSHDYFLIEESAYNAEQSASNQNMIKTGARYVGDYFLYTAAGIPRIEDNMNHSYKPNLLYHCGICFAAQPITTGDELFVNYRYVLSAGDHAKFTDESTGGVVDGVDSLVCLTETTSQLLDILLSKKKSKTS